MAGMDARRGTALDEGADIAQSIAVIITTPIGTRVMRRQFGSLVFDLIDSPATARGALRLIAAAADAIERWEPRIQFRSAQVSAASDGRTVLTVRAVLKIDGRTLTANVTL